MLSALQNHPAASGLAAGVNSSLDGRRIICDAVRLCAKIKHIKNHNQTLLSPVLHSTDQCRNHHGEPGHIGHQHQCGKDSPIKW